MALPKLDPAASDLTLSITINKNLRPYLTAWYNQMKEGSETPEQFVVRNVKEAAIAEYLRVFGVQERQALDAQVAAEEQALLTEVA